MGDRYVVLGLAPARAAWFRAVGSWANSGALPAEFVKCLSAEEVGARLDSARPFSALVADGCLPALDRDLVARATSAGCPVFVVDDRRVRRDWAALGAARVLRPDFDREDLLHALAAHARMVQRSAARADQLLDRPSPGGWRGTVVAVTGPGGTGASTAAMALAQGLGDDVRQAGMVLLADFRLHAELAMLHDAGDVCPGVQELVEAHRAGSPSVEEVRNLVVAPPNRPYRLLLGIRRARFWPTLRPQAFAAAWDSLERSFRVVVADIDPDLEGEDDGGSVDVEERNTMARTAAARAQVVFAVGSPTLKGLHSLVRVVDGLLQFGVAPDRIVPVLNRAHRGARARAGLTATFAELVAPLLPADERDQLTGPIFLPERRIEEALRDGVRLPAALVQPLTGAMRAVVERASVGAVAGPAGPQPVRPGSLGRWSTGFEAAGP
ncbi:MAG: hypothetical protein M3314_13220 [Actinomycetota bacterium]|nr:hypothetical protein [Actinomycetota bacterium]